MLTRPVRSKTYPTGELPEDHVVQLGHVGYSTLELEKERARSELCCHVGRSYTMAVSSHQNIYEPYRTGLHVSYVGHECGSIPDSVVERHAFAAHRLDLSYNQLRTLKGLEHFVQLRELVLDNNRLRDPTEFVYNSQLTTLSLNKNCFSDLEHLLTALGRCYPNLTFLSLLGNPLCPDQITNPDKDEDDYQRYRYYVIHKLRHLRFLDSRCVNSGERREAKRIGAYMKVARPADNSSTTEDRAPSASYFSPLTHTPQPTHRRTMYGTVTYRYTGKHSEGNRFISNDEL